MRGIDPAAFAVQWAAAWNDRDLARVLEHFTDDVTFSSPKALETVGRVTVRGKAALRGYWERALGRVETLRFDVVRALWDPVRSEIGIVYDREVNGRRDRAIELLRFGADGRIVAGEVLYGLSVEGAEAGKR